MKFFYVLLILLCLVFVMPQAQAKEYTVSIPFGAYDPTFETPVENWYEPPVLSIKEGDTITWKKM